MAFDGLVLHTITNELKKQLITARVDKIYQPDSTQINLTLRCKGKNFSLLLSADSQYARVHLTKEKFVNPPHPPAFCMLLRKYLSGGRIVEITQPGFERILHIVIQNRNIDGDIVKYQLIAELMGRHSNLILVSENNIILDAIKRISQGISRYREVLPGGEYIAPPKQDKANPLLAEEATFKALLQLNSEAKIPKAIISNYRGISPLIAREITVQANLHTEQKINELESVELSQLWSSFKAIFDALIIDCTNPSIFTDDSNKIIAFSCFSLKQYPELHQNNYPSMSELLDNYFSRKIKKQLLAQISSEARRIISNLLEKAQKKQEKLLTQIAETEKADEYRIKGEMIKANLYQIKKGSREITVVNYYDPKMKEIKIQLNPAFSPQKNAEKYFKRYNKLKKSVHYIEKELAKLGPEIEYLKNVELSLEQIESKTDFEEIRAELIQEGYLKENRKTTPNRQQRKSKPMKFKSSDGFDILVGRNNIQNDKLTKGVAARDDYWFHVKDLAGSHVIVRNPDKGEIPDLTLEEAAVLAAYFSKARESSSIPVDYTKIKYVNKTKGAKPGMVIYDNYKTILIHPDEKQVDKLRVPEN